jgi:hypothetical protein
MTSRDKGLYTRYIADFIEAHKPDIVHFQHTLFIGFDVVSAVRRLLPDVPIFYTLHEYLPICHRDGQMLRINGELCTHESPRRCNECYPHWSQQHFFLRKQLIQRHLSNVDLFRRAAFSSSDTRPGASPARSSGSRTTGACR